MKKTILISLSFVVCISQVMAKSGQFDCVPDNLECHVIVLENVLKKPEKSNLDNAITLIQNSRTDMSWKKNSLGLLYMFRKDKASINKAEKLFLDALNMGVRSAAQNLAELYFLKEDIENSFKYIKLVESYKYEFPDIKYLNWARLYGQLLYLHGNNAGDQNKAILLLKDIQSLDKTGVSIYLIGFHEFQNGKLKSGLTKLERASELGAEQAALFLGDLYFSGERVKKNLIKAKAFYLIAANKDSGRAHFNLFVIYRDEGDVAKMRKHLTLATKLKNKKALELWERLKK